MSNGIMPNMYTTTYRSYFKPHSSCSNDINRDMHVKRNMKSIYSLDNPSLPQQQQQQQTSNVTNERLPPLNPRSAASSVAMPSDNNKQFNMKPNVQRSGFWCENPVVDHQSKCFELKTTNQEMFGQTTHYESNNKRNNGKYSIFPSNAISPYVREPILVPSINPSDEAMKNDTYTTTMQKSYPKYESKQVAIPTNVSMATTGFQRSSDESIDIKSGTSAPKMTKSEIERLRFRDPVAYLDAQNDDNPYISMNQLCYQVPVRPKPF